MPQAPQLALSALNFGAYPMVNGQRAPRRALLRRDGAARRARRQRSDDALAADAALALGLVTAAPDDLDWADEIRIALEERASLSPDALTGMEANLRFGGAETMETRIFGRLSAWQNWIFIRPNAVGEAGALKVFGNGRQGRHSTGTASERDATIEERHEHIDYSEKIPNNVNLADDRTLQRALEHWQPEFLQLVGATWARTARTATDVYLRTAVSVEPKGWAHFDYVKMPDYRWGIFLAPAEAGPQDQLRRAQGRAGVAGGAGRAPRQPAPPHRHAGRHRARVGRAAAPPRPHLPVALRPAQPVPGQRRGRPPPVGDGLPAARATSAATAARKPRRCSSAAPATPTTRASSARSTSRRRTGSRSSCSPTSPTATASSSSARSPNRASIRSRAPAASC